MHPTHKNLLHGANSDEADTMKKGGRRVSHLELFRTAHGPKATNGLFLELQFLPLCSDELIGWNQNKQ